MPVNATTIIALVTFVLAVAVWLKSRRIGPVVGVLITGMVVIAATDASFLNEGANGVKKLFRWGFRQITGG